MDLDEAKSKPYYWTAFAYEGLDPNDYHCTHKFLGDLSAEDAISIGNILVDYFDQNPFQSFTARFDKEEFFGENEDVRVLTTDEPVNSFLPELRNKINFREDDFSYNPHVTDDDAKEIELPFQRYVYMRGKEILVEWTAKN